MIAVIIIVHEGAPGAVTVDAKANALLGTEPTEGEKRVAVAIHGALRNVMPEGAESKNVVHDINNLTRDSN